MNAVRLLGEGEAGHVKRRLAKTLTRCNDEAVTNHTGNSEKLSSHWQSRQVEAKLSGLMICWSKKPCVKRTKSQRRSGLVIYDNTCE